MSAENAHSPEKTLEEQPTTDTSQPVKRKRGRPRKADVEAKKAGNRGKRGRPAGDAARMNELKARLLATSGDKVIQKIIDIALDDEHTGQMAALKMCADRVLPVSLFEPDKASRGGNAISINITGIGVDSSPKDITPQPEQLDVTNIEYVEYKDE